MSYNGLPEHDYATIARAVHVRRLESRDVARRKVIELTADVADVLAHRDPHFDLAWFYRLCGFTGDDIEAAQTRNAIGS